MKNTLKLTVLTAALALGAMTSNANAAYVQDGNFALPAVAGSYTTYNAGQTFGAWNVDSGNVDLIGSYWMQPTPGSGSVDLDGNNPGSISQTLSTIPAGSFLLSFSFSGNPDGGSPIKSLAVSVGNVIGQVFSYTTGANSDTHMNWITETLAFNTTGPTTLKFASLTTNPNSANGPAISNVSISAVPLPAGLPMFATALLAMVGVYHFRKRQSLA